MTYDISIKTARMTAVRDQLNAGTLQLMAGATVVREYPLAGTSGAVAGDVLTFAGFPQTVASAGEGTIDGARLRKAGDLPGKSGLTVGLPGSNADVEVDNGLGSLVIGANDPVTVLVGPTLTHAA